MNVQSRISRQRTGATSAACRDASRQQTLWRLHRNHQSRSHGRQGRVLRTARPVRLRQVDDAAHDRRTGGGDVRLDLHQRRQRHQAAPGQTPHRHGFPVLCALSASDGAPEHRVLAVGGRCAAGGADEALRRDRSAVAARPSDEPQAGAAFRRPAAAGRHRPGAGPRAGSVPVRRAAIEPRRACCACRCVSNWPSCTRRSAPR